MVREEVESYNKLLSEVLKTIGDTEVEASLKKQFTNVIESRRTYFTIKTYKDLIKVLDDRDEISEKDVSSLKYILKDVQISKGPNDNYKQSLELVNVFEKLHKPELDSTICSICRAPNSRPNLVALEVSAAVSPQPTPVHEDGPELFADVWRAIHEIYEELAGSNWLKLGRTLGVKDGYLEELKYSQQPHSEKVNDMFKKWISFKGEKASIEALIKALDDKKVARKDLALRLKKKFPR